MHVVLCLGGMLYSHICTESCIKFLRCRLTVSRSSDTFAGNLDNLFVYINYIYKIDLTRAYFVHQLWSWKRLSVGRLRETIQLGGQLPLGWR